jgi:hypothetical protein
VADSEGGKVLADIPIYETFDLAGGLVLPDAATDFFKFRGRKRRKCIRGGDQGECENGDGAKK